jgi:ATP-dependent RNA circularization protein (DNA/RNA ligase family)
MVSMKNKPLGFKNYGSIPHLPGSRRGPGDHGINQGQADIATKKTRDRHDVVIVQEKLDGSNVGVCKINGEIIPLTRSGYDCRTSNFETHHNFASFVDANRGRFDLILDDGERVCGEWLGDPVGTIYDLPHEPFVMFDKFNIENKRLSFIEMREFSVMAEFFEPYLISFGDAYSIDSALADLGEFGFHGAKEQQEGAVWRVERKGKLDFICKYVREEKVDGKYFS